ncbi:MAG: hypothetical protein U5S82_23130 [Gammaproteobacteria bacterium]|nr:hypothetical protein [Gammaproteobacteria bacterium]
MNTEFEGTEMTARELASVLGVTQRMVDQFVQAGMPYIPPPPEKKRGRTFDSAMAIRWLINRRVYQATRW